MSRSFQDYLEAKMQPVEKPPVETLPDYKGKPNPFVKKSKEQKNCCGGEDGKRLAGTPRVEEVPDFHGKPNPGVKKGNKPQVVEVSTFAEYINSKGKLEDPKVALNVNFTQPEGPTDGMPGPSSGKALPYVSKAEKGDDWAKLGSGNPYIPKTDVKKDTVVYSQDQKKTKQQPQAESILKNMSLVEVTTYLQKQNDLLKEDALPGDVPTVTAWHTGKTMPDPLETIEYITHLASKNNELMETLIRKLKGKKGGMESLMEQLLNHPESVNELAKHLDGEKGPSHAGGLARAMAERFRGYMDEFHSVNESALSPPVGFGDEDRESEDGDEEENYGDDEDSNVDDSDSDSDADDIDDSEAPDDDSDDLPEMPHHSHDEEDGDEEPLPEMPKRKKPSRTFSHHHLISAMGGHKHMHDAMKEHLGESDQ